MLGGPLIVQNLFGYSLPVLAAVFVGHLDDAVLLSAAVLANSLYNVTGLSLIVGLSSGSETLSGQAYGARNYRMLGVVLQRALLICCAACVPITLLWLRVDGLLGALRQPPAIALRAGRYLRLISPTLYISVLQECVRRYLLAQRVVRPGMVITAVSTLLSPLYSYALMYRWRLGLDGAAYAFNLSQATSAALLLGYTLARDRRLRGTPEQTWFGWSWACFDGWKTYLAYGLPATAMLCAEWWAFECTIFMAGLLPDAEVAVRSYTRRRSVALPLVARQSLVVRFF